MQFRLKLAALFSLTVGLCLAEDRSKRDVPDNNLAYPANIHLGGTKGGTGFHLNSEKGSILVTAGHVLFNPVSGKLNSANVTISSPSGDPKEAARQVYTVDLVALSQRGEALKHSTADVAIVRVARFIDVENGFAKDFCDEAKVLEYPVSAPVGFDPSVLATYDKVLVSNEIYLYGYPLSIGLKQIPQIDHTRPLLRKGIVAGLNPLRRTIIIDCPVFPGNSGSPIVQVIRKPIASQMFQLIGVASQFIPFEDRMTSARFKYTNVSWANSGYAVVEPMDRVLELVDTLR